MSVTRHEHLLRLKLKHGIVDRADIVTIPDLIDFDEGRKS
jgi:hypothetical protein